MALSTSCRSTAEVMSKEQSCAMRRIVADPAARAGCSILPAPEMADAPLVLVVDDYRDARELYAETLLVAGFRVAEAADGHQAVDRARALLPDVVLMDLSLPGKDGWQATRELKA